MDVYVQGGAKPTPFLQARDIFQTEFDLERPVKVFVQDDPDARTWTSHPPEYHHLNISKPVASSGLARELAVHEFAHMYRHEEGHVSHHLSTEEAIYLAAAGRRIPRDHILHCFQIANHMKDIYADDLTMSVARSDKLVAFLESSLANVLVDGQPTAVPPGVERISPTPDRSIAAVNAAFALGLLDRHHLVDDDHHVHNLAHILATDAPHVPFDRFRALFSGLTRDPDERTYRRSLVTALGSYLGGVEHAAD